MAQNPADLLRFFSSDGELDLEDVDHAVQVALADGRLDASEGAALRDALTKYRERMEPGAARYLEEVLAGKAPQLVNRVLLAPHPRTDTPDRYYPRSEAVALQERLGWLGYTTNVDGDYGPGTSRSVAAFQAAHGLPANGVVDSRTLHKLNLALAESGKTLLDLNPRARIRPDAVIAVKGTGERATVKAMQGAINHLNRHFGTKELPVIEDGSFGAKSEAALAKIQSLLYLPPTGIFDVSTARAMNLLLAVAGKTPLSETPPAAGGNIKDAVELHFYPNDNEQKVYVLRGGRVLDSYAMVGGERVGRADPSNRAVEYSPTPAGRYEVVKVDPHSSASWPFSYVPYGAQLRDVGGEIQYRDGSGQWRWATGPQSVFLGREPAPLAASHYRNSDGTLPPTWTKNEFGHIRALLRDARTKASQTHMIHATPYGELSKVYNQDTSALLVPAKALEVLGHSHGCEHIHPKDLDEMVSKGYIRPGTVFVVHGYDERSGNASLV